MNPELNKFYLRVAKIIQNRRLELGHSQAKLARESGLSRPTIINIENGRSPISVHAMFAITIFLGIDLDSFMEIYEGEKDNRSFWTRPKSAWGEGLEPLRPSKEDLDKLPW